MCEHIFCAWNYYHAYIYNYILHKYIRTYIYKYKRERERENLLKFLEHIKELYLNNFVNNLGSRFEDVFDDDEKRIIVEGLVGMSMSIINLVYDLLITHGEEPHNLLLNVMHS